MVARNNIEKGQQVYDSYGAKSNFELLSDYGFIDSSNKVVTSSMLDVELDEGDPIFALKKEILGSKTIGVFLKAVPSR